VPHFLRVFFAAALLVALAGCNPPRGAALQSEVLAGSQDKDADFAVVPVTRASLQSLGKWPATGGGGHSWPKGTGGGSLLIQPGDMLNVVVWDSQQNSLLTTGAQKTVDIKGLTVSSGGMIYIPYVEGVKVSGMTSEQARRTIQTRMEAIVPSAQVQVFVVPGNSNTADLVGGVAKPGRVMLTDGGMSILSLLSEGGGVPPALRNPIVQLQRGGHTYSMPVSEIYANPGYDITMRGGDRVVVQQDDRYFLALGAAGKEQLAYFTKDDITALDAISLIGGVNDNRADLKGVMVLRQYANSALRPDGSGPSKTQMVFTFDLTTVDGLFAASNFKINPKDVVLATESAFPIGQMLLGMINTSLVVRSRAAAL
jgi:polysaccharide biosynthesis/export protein